jgi:hypothetical protein
MLHGFFGGGSLSRIYFEQPSYKVDEVGIFALKSVFESGLLGHQDVNLQIILSTTSSLLMSSARIRHVLAILIFFRTTFLIDKTFPCKKAAYQSTFFHHVLRNRAYDAKNSRKQALHRIVLEENISGIKLCKYATKGPHVYLVVISAAKDNFWGSVRS